MKRLKKDVLYGYDRTKPTVHDGRQRSWAMDAWSRSRQQRIVVLKKEAQRLIILHPDWSPEQHDELRQKTALPEFVAVSDLMLMEVVRRMANR